MTDSAKYPAIGPSPVPSPTGPMEQLVLVNSELERELASVSARQANAVTRASIVLAAAGISAFATVSSSRGWNLVPVVFSLISAAFCLGVIRYWTSRAVQLKRAHVAAYLSSDPYSLLWRLVSDRFDELDAARADLAKKTNLFEGAVTMLILAWTSGVAARFLIDPLLTINRIH